MLLHQILLPLLAFVSLSTALLGGYQGGQQPAPQIYCGRALSRLIANICYDVPIDSAKRSEVATMYGALIPPYYKEQDNRVDWPWSAHKSNALGSMRGKRFISGGVADECCDKPCSITELLVYC